MKIIMRVLQESVESKRLFICSHIQFEYVLLVPVKGKEMKITFDDWIFKQDDRVAKQSNYDKVWYKSC